MRASNPSPRSAWLCLRKPLRMMACSIMTASSARTLPSISESLSHNSFVSDFDIGSLIGCVATPKIGEARVAVTIAVAAPVARRIA